MTPEEAETLTTRMAELREALHPTGERFQFLSLDDLRQVTELKETVPWPPDLVAELREKEYRRAYRDGWIAAIDRAYELMFDLHFKREDAYRLLFNHWEHALGVWAQADCTRKKSMSANERPFEDGGDLPPYAKAPERKGE